MALPTWMVDDGFDFITLQEAADIAGYRTASNLYAAARGDAPKLKTIVIGKRGRLTMRAWLEAYLSTIKKEPHRGQRRSDGDDVATQDSRND